MINICFFFCYALRHFNTSQFFTDWLLIKEYFQLHSDNLVERRSFPSSLLNGIRGYSSSTVFWNLSQLRRRYSRPVGIGLGVSESKGVACMLHNPFTIIGTEFAHQQDL